MPLPNTAPARDARPGRTLLRAAVGFGVLSVVGWTCVAIVFAALGLVAHDAGAPLATWLPKSLAGALALRFAFRAGDRTKLALLSLIAADASDLDAALLDPETAREVERLLRLDAARKAEAVEFDRTRRDLADDALRRSYETDRLPNR